MLIPSFYFLSSYVLLSQIANFYSSIYFSLFYSFSSSNNYFSSSFSSQSNPFTYDSDSDSESSSSINLSSSSSLSFSSFSSFSSSTNHRLISYLNCRSLSKSFSSLTSHLTSHPHTDVFALVETWPQAFHSSSLSHWKIPSYNFHDTIPYQSATTNGGGIGFYIKSHLIFQDLSQYSYKSSTSSTQIHTISISAPYQLLITCIYLHPSATPQELQTIENILQRLYLHSSSLLILGDFNRHHSILQSLSNSLFSVNDTFCLDQPTHITIRNLDTGRQSISKSILDYAFIDDLSPIQNMYIDSSSILMTDHFPLHISFSPSSLSYQLPPSYYEPDLHWEIPHYNSLSLLQQIPRYHSSLNIVLSSWMDSYLNITSLHSQQHLDEIYEDLITCVKHAALTVWPCHNLNSLSNSSPFCPSSSSLYFST